MNRKTSSLASHFLLFSVGILTTVMLLSTRFWMQAYNEELQAKLDKLPARALRVDTILTDSIDSLGQYTEFLGEKIVQHHNPADWQYVAQLMGGKFRTKRQEHNFYFTTTFDWLTPDKQIRVSSKMGILPKAFDMTDREYVDRAMQMPWQLQLGAPRIGGLSGQWIIPAGLGITDEQDKLIGTITFGFSLQGLAQRLVQTEGPTDIHYVVLSKDFKPILDSTKEEAMRPDTHLKMDIAALKEALQKGNGFFNRPVEYENIHFNYARQMDKYPYIILSGYDADMETALFNKVVLSHLLELFVICLLALILLFAIRWRLVKPILELAHAADLISRGKNVSIQPSDIQEISVLGEQMQKISTYIQNEHYITKELLLKTELLERKTMQLETANTEAITSRDRAIKADRAKSEFLANMSHELRTPMNAVIGLTHILLAQKLTPERQKEFLETLQRSSHHLLHIINDLLDIAKLEADQVKLEEIPLNLHEIVMEVIAMHQEKATERNIALVIKEDTHNDLRFMGDPVRLRQILMNLVANALKFTEKGEIIIELQGRSKQGSAWTNVEIQVRDTGIGIAKEKLESIFDKFSQADNSITRKYGGTGLGLSITKNLVELMGGTITVQSTLEQGSCFTVRLPLRNLVETNTVAIPSNESVAPKKMHILVVEDNRENTLVVATFLKNFGHSYVLANTGKEAIEKMAKEHFDMVLMDIQMPEIDGFSATLSIREKEKAEGLPRTPIIGMTAYALTGDRDRCLAAGMDGYLAKPFKPSDLAAILQQCTKSGESLPEVA